MKKRLLAAVLAVCVLCAGCAAAKTDFSLESVENEGGFAFASLPWGISIAEAEDALGVSLGDPLGGSEESGYDYRASSDWEVASFATSANLAALGERAVPLQLQFRSGALYSIVLTASGNDLKREDFEALVTRAIERFGAASHVSDSAPLTLEDGDAFGTMVTESVWVLEHDGTRTQLHLMLTESATEQEITSYSLILNAFPV